MAKWDQWTQWYWMYKWFCWTIKTTLSEKSNHCVRQIKPPCGTFGVASSCLGTRPTPVSQGVPFVHHFLFPRGKKRNSANAVIPGSDGETFLAVVPQYYLEHMKKHQVTRSWKSEKYSLAGATPKKSMQRPPKKIFDKIGPMPDSL